MANTRRLVVPKRSFYSRPLAMALQGATRIQRSERVPSAHSPVIRACDVRRRRPPRRPTCGAQGTQRQQDGYWSPADVDVPNSQRTLPPPSQRVEAAPQTCPSSHDRARRAYASGNKAIGRLRSLSSLLTFIVWHVCVRCHRSTRGLRAFLRSGSELVSLSDRILLLVACRLRARVIHACDVGIARRGAQIGRP